MATIFTKIINKEIPANIVYEDEDVIAFKDIAPVAPVHILVVPKKEIATINDIKEDDAYLIGKVYLTISKLAK
ncbi:HIT domain-containing protein, partial [Fusobacterium sp.]